MSVEERVRDLLEGVVASVGVELLDVEYNGGSLRITVDTESGGIADEQLAEVSRLISPLLDQHDPVPGRYLLEVSSPGLERRLRTPAHFTRAVGEQVIVKLTPGTEPRRIRGELVAAEEAEVTIVAVEVDGIDLKEPDRRTVEMASIDSARTVFEWGPAPKPGKAGKKKQPPQARGVR